MTTDRIRFEVIVSGFFHIVWMVMLWMVSCNISPNGLFVILRDVQVGFVAILAPITVGASFFLGMLVDRTLSSMSPVYYFVTRQQMPPSKVRRSKDGAHQLDLRWVAKAFFRSVSLAGIMITYLSFRLKADWSILTFEGVLEVVCIYAFLTARSEYAKH